MKTELVRAPDGTIEIWRGSDLVGTIEPTAGGIRVAMGDVDPENSITLIWGGEPFSLRFELGGSNV